MRISIICVATLVTACTSTGVVPSDGDTFMIGKKSAQIGFGPPVKTEAAVFAEASDYCAGQGKEVETADLIVRNSVPGRPASVNLKFRCVDPGTSKTYTATTDPATASGAGMDTASTEGEQSNPSPRLNDKYDNLERLKKLLDDGAITQEEYNSEKAKILND